MRFFDRLCKALGLSEEDQIAYISIEIRSKAYEKIRTVKIAILSVVMVILLYLAILFALEFDLMPIRWM